jgi:hypothetical protein
MSGPAHRTELTEKDREVIANLARLRSEGDPRFHQYLDSVTGGSGLLLRIVAEGMGVSQQRVSQLRDIGRKQRRSGDHRDLSGLPFPTMNIGQDRRSYQRPVPPTTEQRLRELNAKAKAYKAGDDPTQALAFYDLVRELHRAGVSFNAIARSVGEEPKYFLRRVQRWGLTRSAPKNVRRTVPTRRKSE